MEEVIKEIESKPRTDGLKYLMLKEKYKELENIHRIIKEEHRAFIKALNKLEKQLKDKEDTIKVIIDWVNKQDFPNKCGLSKLI